MLWIKTFHLFFVIAWFAGLFYLPRIFVNLAMTPTPAVTERLLTMARKLFRFTTFIAIPAVLFGLWLFVGYGIGLNGPGNAWMHAKLFFVLLVIGYHWSCGILLSRFERGLSKYSDRWYRFYNEIPAFLLLIIVGLVIIKPFRG